MCNVTISTTPDANGVITVPRPTLTMPGDMESGWRWCKQCQGLFLASSGHGTCPVRPTHRGMPARVIGPHTDNQSGHYALYFRRAPGCVQTGWTRCARCHGLYFGQNGRVGRCPASSQGHSPAAGVQYELHTCDGAGGQEGWRWCHKCEGMFYSLSESSACPAGGAHDASQSGTYFIPWGS